MLTALIIRPIIMTIIRPPDLCGRHSILLLYYLSVFTELPISHAALWLPSNEDLLLIGRAIRR